MPIAHDLLQRQVERHFGDLSAVPLDLLPLLEMVGRAYADFEAAAARSEIEARLAGIVESSLDGIIVVDDRQRIVLFNPAAARIFQCTERETLGQSLDRFIPARFLGEHARHIQEFAASGRTARSMGGGIQLTGVRAGGDEFALEASISRFVVDGRVFLATSLRDITQHKRAEAELRRSEQRYRSLVESAPICINEIDRDGRFLSMNRAGLGMLGLQEEHEIRGKPFQLAICAQDQSRVEAAFNRALGGSPSEIEFQARNGHHLQAAFIPIKSALGGIERLMGITQDITERKRAEQALRESEARYRHLFERSVSGVYQTALDGRILDCNQAFASMLGYQSPEDLMRLPASALYADDGDRSSFIRALLHSKRLVNVEFTGRRKDRSEFVGLESVELVADRLGGEPFLLGSVIDITERRRAELELTRLMTHDSVTGLKRYVVMRGEIDELLASAASGSGVALLYIDIDRFRSINEAMGYETGDLALRVCAQRISACLPSADAISRLGGDEFLVVVTEEGTTIDPLQLADRIRAAIEMPIVTGAYQLRLTCSIGISHFPEHGASASALLRAADAAMTRAKRGGRNGTAVFSLAQAAALNDRLALGGRLRDAIAAGEMVLHYQPLVHASTGQVMGVEALVRWNSPELGLLLPARFIQVAEELGLIIELGQWVLEEACRQIKSWIALGHRDFYVSVNVSAHQITRLDFAEQVRAIIERAGVLPGMLELELTESALADSVERMVESMHALKKLGVKLALDDFGTGYSSLNHLKRLPLHKLKIDQSFVREMTQDANDAAIIRAIIAMGHQLHLTVTAEGVETEAQLGYLRRNHCDDIQGMLLSPPLVADQISKVFSGRYLMPEAFAATQPSRGLLLLDDDENILHSLSRLLRRDGYRIHTATNAAQAFEILGCHDIQVIVSDERMPGIRGTVFLSQVKDMYPETIRIMLSGYTDLTSVTEAINRGAIYKFLTKPWVDEDLREQIAAAFRAYALASP
mgnify:CR=1 FL=1